MGVLRSTVRVEITVTLDGDSFHAMPRLQNWIASARWPKDIRFHGMRMVLIDTIDPGDAPEEEES